MIRPVRGARGRTLRTAPWRRAPALLFGQPGVILALLLASAVLAVAAASATVFLSEVGTAALHVQAAQQCPEAAQPAVSLEKSSYETYGRLDNSNVDAAVAAAYRAQRLPAPQNVLQGFSVISATRTPPQQAPQYVDAFWRPGALAHVHRVATAGGRGLWLTTYAARQFGVRPGGTVYVNGHAVRVVGTYQRLDDPLDPAHDLERYWCTWHDEINQSLIVDSSPAFALATDPALVLDTRLNLLSTWYSQVHVDDLTLDAASSAARRGELAGRAASRALESQSLDVAPDFAAITRARR